MADNKEKEVTLYDNYLYLRKATYIQPGINRASVEKTIEYFGRGDSVAALVVKVDTNEFVLVKQFRYPALQDGGSLLEIVAGGIEDESPEICIRREVLEEIGYEVHDLSLIATMYVSPGRTDERLFLFLCTVDDHSRKHAGGGLLSEHEDIEVVHLAIKDARRMLDNRELLDAKTILALQHYFLSLA